MLTTLDLITLISDLVNCAYYISLHEIWFGSNMEIKSVLRMPNGWTKNLDPAFFLAKTSIVFVVTRNNFPLRSTSFLKSIR